MKWLVSIWQFIIVTFPNDAAILVGCMIGTQFVKKREHFCLRFWLSFLGIALWMYWTRNILSVSVGLEYSGIIAFTGLFVFSVLVTLFWCYASIYQALFAVTVSYAIQNICERLVEIPMEYWPRFPRQVIILLLMISLLWYHRICKKFEQKQMMLDFSKVDSRMMLLIAIGTVFVCVVIDIVLRQETENASPLSRVCIDIIMILFSFLTVLVSMSHLRETDAKIRADRAVQMLHTEQRRFEYDKQIHDAINTKCHDIRHQISAIRSSSTDDHYRAELKKIGKLVDIYDTTPHSQNTALDVVLSGKMLTCNSKNIVITCIADGRRLGFMDDCDIYALFGNILDNAMEAVEHVSDPEKRMISLQVYTQDDFLKVEEENFFEGSLQYEGGLPATTKTDRINHGFGIQSIRMLVEKYDGTLKIQTQEDIFTLSILIPIPASA